VLTPTFSMDGHRQKEEPMTTKVEKTLLINVPVRVAYNQWTQFEEFPRFMSAVSEVRQLDDRRLHWVAEIAGVKREWDAEILEQVPDRKIAWKATEGATNAGAVYFSDNGASQCTVTLSLEYEPEGLLESAGERLHLVEKHAEEDLQRFKTIVEDRGYDTGGWRGTVNAGAVAATPGVEAAASTRGDKGKAGLSTKAKAAGALVAAAGVVAAGALRGARDGATQAYRQRPPRSGAVGSTPVAERSPITADELRT
jgi:uncharacterized membrane protein